MRWARSDHRRVRRCLAGSWHAAQLAAVPEGEPDALAAAAAAGPGITLATRDRRAAGTCRVLDAGFGLAG